METVTLEAPNISCQHCIMAVQRAVGSLPGVISVEGDPMLKHVTVKYDSNRVSIDQIEQAMANAGYPPVPAVR